MTWKTAYCPLAVHHPHTPRYQHAYLAAIGDDGSHVCLGSKWLPAKLSNQEMKDALMEAFWDPRLDAASCTPYFYTTSE